MNLKKRIEKLEKKLLSTKIIPHGKFIIPTKLNLTDEELAILELELLESKINESEKAS